VFYKNIVSCKTVRRWRRSILLVKGDHCVRDCIWLCKTWRHLTFCDRLDKRGRTVIKRYNVLIEYTNTLSTYYHCNSFRRHRIRE